MNRLRRIGADFHANPGRYATLLAWLSQGLSIAGNLALIPLLLARLGAASGFWFFLLAWSGAFTVLDFGFSLCVSRQITFSQGERRLLALRPRGPFIRVGGARTVAQLVAGSKILFRIGSILTVLFGIAAERTFLFGGQMNGTPGARTCWYLMVAAAVALNESRIYSTALTGALLIPWLRLVQLGQAMLQLGLLFLFLIVAPRLEWLGLALLLANLFAWTAARGMWRRLSPLARLRAAPKWSVARRLWHLSWQQGLASAAAYCIFTFNPVLVGYLAGPLAVATYYLPLRIAMIICTFLSEIMNPQVNLMIASYRDHQTRALLLRFFRILYLVTGLALLAYGVFVLAGPLIVAIWSAGRIHPPLAVFWFIGLYYFLVVIQHHLFCFITAHGINAFVWVATLGAVLNIAFIFYGIPLWGLSGAAFGTFLAQLLTSNWFMVWYAGRLLRGHNRDYPVRRAWREALRAGA